MKTDEIQEPSHPVGWYDNVEEVGVQGKPTLSSLVNEIVSVEEGECESCAV